MNACDVGVFCMPPINVNARYALPNKFFDFVQARLAVAVGPAEEMAPADPRARARARCRPTSARRRSPRRWAGWTPTAVRGFKAAAHAHARELSSERDEQVERDLVTRLLGR